MFEKRHLFCYNINMITLVAPKHIARGTELVVIPRKEYERFLRFQKSVQMSPREEALEEGLADARAGRITPAFSSVKAFKRFLKK